MGASGSRFDPYTIVVTGCSSGIGQATALALHQAGFNVLAGVRKLEDAERLRAAGLHPITLDVTNEQHVRELPATVAKLKTVGSRVAVVCNAGIAFPGPVESTSEADVRAMFDVNVFGLLSVTRAMLPMIRETKGRVVFVGSALGLVSFPYFSIYCATKFAVEAIADGLRREVAPLGVAVSLVEPGLTKTPAISEDFAKKVHEKAIANSPAVYEAGIRAHWKQQQEGAASSASPEEVAALVLEALRAASPSHRYRGPGGAGALAFLSCLPIPCVDRLLT
eukprot:tig00020614_g12181.t1